MKKQQQQKKRILLQILKFEWTSGPSHSGYSLEYTPWHSHTHTWSIFLYLLPSSAIVSLKKKKGAGFQSYNCQNVWCANKLYTDITVSSIAILSSLCVQCMKYACEWGVKGNTLVNFYVWLWVQNEWRIHHRAVCAYTDSLAFWLMCVHTCMWIKRVID